jgi:hypothetical protein
MIVDKQQKMSFKLCKEKGQNDKYGIYLQNIQCHL